MPCEPGIIPIHNYSNSYISSNVGLYTYDTLDLGGSETVPPLLALLIALGKVLSFLDVLLELRKKLHHNRTRGRCSDQAANYWWLWWDKTHFIQILFLKSTQLGKA